MKRILLLFFACMNFCSVFSAEHNDQELLQQLSDDELQGVIQFLEQHPQPEVARRLLGQRLLRIELLQPTLQQWPIVGIAAHNIILKNKEGIKLLQKRRVREAILEKGIELDNVSDIIGPLSREGKKVILVEISEIEEGPIIPVRRIRLEEVFFEEHTRRGDKYKKTGYPQYTQAHQRTNNRKQFVQLNNKYIKRNY